MTQRALKKQVVYGPDGLPITAASLPTRRGRMTPKRKVIILLAVEAGVITEAEAKKLYSISDDEWRDEWVKHFRDHGMAGLRVTRVQEYRS